MTLTFKKWGNFKEELTISCFNWFPAKEGIYYKTSKYGEFEKVDSKEYCLWEVQYE